MRGGTFLLFGITIVFSLSLTGCLLFSEKRWEYRIVAGPSAPTRIHVAYDSPEVRKFVADRNPIDGLLKMPGFTVPVKSYCSIIQQSTSKHGLNPEATAVYVLIKVTSGPAKGQQGWAWQRNVQQLFP